MSSIIKPRRSGGVIGTIGPIGGSGVFSLQERHALSVDHYDDVSLYLKMNGASGSTTFYDSSKYGHTVTANGNAQISTAQSKFGGASAAFDGTGDYLTVPDDASVQLGSSDFTIEGWFYSNVSSPARQYHLFFINGVAAGDRAVGLAIRGDAGLGGKLRLVVEDDASVQRVTIDSPDAFPANSWQHVAVVRSGALVTLYLNGTNIGSGSLPSAGTSLLAGTLNWIGNYSFATGTFTWDGYIDDIRITKGVARYGSFQPPAQAFPGSAGGDPDFADVSLLLHMDGADGSTTFTDSSSNGHTVTANGNAQISTAESKFGGASAAFDGTGDYLTVANDASLQLASSGAWTLEFWFYANALATQQHLLHRYLVTSPFNGFGVAFGSGGAATTTLRFWDGATWRDIETSVATGQWRHVAVSYEGAGTTARMFLDGVQKGSAFTPSASIANTANNLGIGAQYDGSLPFNGYIDDLRITKGVARYTGNFTPPQREFLP